MSDARTQELADNLQNVRERIDAACLSVGRRPSSTTLIVVTKFFDADDVRRLAELGVRDVGENRAQEAAAKYAQCCDEWHLDLVWHYIGQLQTNKAKAVVAFADLIHTVDRASLAAALNKAAAALGKQQEVLIQVNLDPQPRPERGGAAPADVPALVQAVTQCDALRLRGVMGVAPLGEDPDPAFAELARICDRIKLSVPDADIISAGMSHDLEAAIAHGATHLRVGAAVMGDRPTVGYRPTNSGKHNEGNTQ